MTSEKQVFELSELFERISAMSFGQGFSAGLRPTQWAALRYFLNAPQEDCTVGKFAEFHLTTPGAASQTIETLVRRGMLSRMNGSRDRRSHFLEVTAFGLDALRSDPMRRLSGALQQLDSSMQESLKSLLLGVMQRMNDELDDPEAEAAGAETLAVPQQRDCA